MLDAVPDAQTTASSKAVKGRMMPTILHPDAIMISMHRVQAENKAYKIAVYHKPHYIWKRSAIKLVHQNKTKH